jgi:RimJ/RimL family protein N-acetyltransferase
METLTTERLELIAATLELADADLYNRLEFSHRLNARALPSWPPPLHDENAMRRTVDFLRKNPEAGGWSVWYLVAKRRKRVVVGLGGVKSVSAAGAVEIECSLLPEFRKNGYETEAVAALRDWADASAGR